MLRLIRMMRTKGHLTVKTISDRTTLDLLLITIIMS